MGLIQRAMCAILPKRPREAMEAESRQWIIRCLTCGAKQSVWEAGGVRWGAYSKGKRTMIWCRRCVRLRCSSVTHESKKPD